MNDPMLPTQDVAPSQTIPSHRSVLSQPTDPTTTINLEWLSTISNRKFFCIAVLVLLITILVFISKVVNLIGADKELLHSFTYLAKKLLTNISTTD